MNPIPWHRRRGTWTALAAGLALLAIFNVWEAISISRGFGLPWAYDARAVITAAVFALAAVMVWAHRPPPSPRPWPLPPGYGGYPAQPPPPEYREQEYRQPPPQAPMPPAPMPPAAPRAGDGYGHLDDLFGGGGR